MRQGFHFAMAMLASFALVTGTATASLPVFNGLISLPSIVGPSDPEEYSWEVQLDGGQSLKLADVQHVILYYNDDEAHPALVITAPEAHDASGASVPTSLDVSEGNVLTLTIHHRDGNPNAAGAPFDYPIVDGPGWEGGFVTHRIEMPPPEITSTQTATSAGPTQCVVPKLKGETLPAARRFLRKAGCRLGAVRRPVAGRANGRIVRQAERPGNALPHGSRVGVSLGRAYAAVVTRLVAPGTGPIEPPSS
jgi:hypothetical protein